MDLTDEETARSAPVADYEFQWIEDEGLLRDEGVMFGLSSNGEGLQAKERCIQSYYARGIAASERQREEVLTAQNAVAAEAGLLRRAIAVMDDAAANESPHESSPPAAHLTRDVLGLLLAGAITVANAVLVYDILQPVFAHPGWVTAGILLGGMFLLYAPVAPVFTSDQAQRDSSGSAELWKVRLAEFGLPLAAAGFIVAWGGEGLGVVRSVATFLFLVLLFAFTGKLLLSTVTRIGTTFGHTRARRADARDRATRRAELGERLGSLAAQDGELRQKLAEIRSEAEWTAIRDAKIHLFRSEFELAAASRRPSPVTARPFPQPFQEIA